MLEITTTDWPRTTRSILEYMGSLPPDSAPGDCNLQVLALVRARKAIMDARLACRSAAKEWREKHPAVAERLEELSVSMLEAHNRFPLDVDRAPWERKHGVPTAAPGERPTLPYHFEYSSKASPL